MILGVAGGINPVHETGHFRHPLAEKLQGLVQRMRAGVEQVAAVKSLQRLPVPAPGETVEGDGNLDDPAQYAGIDHLLHLLEITCQAGLLINREQPPGFLGGGNHLVHIRHPRRQRLLAKHVKAGLQNLQRNRHMHVAEGRIDDQINVLAFEQIVVIGIGVALIVRHRPLPALFQEIRHGHDLIPLIFLQIFGMNIAAAASLPDNRQTYFAHCWLYLSAGCFPNFPPADNVPGPAGHASHESS